MRNSILSTRIRSLHRIRYIRARTVSTVHIDRSTSQPNSSETTPQEITKLANHLLERTRQLMGRQQELCAHHLVAFSGGIDSSLVAFLVKENQSSTQERTQAILGVSPAVPREQIELARRVANHIGIELKEVNTTEGNDQMYIENAGQACLACKTHLYSTLQAVIDHANQQKGIQMYNGTNADDLKDPTRLGLIAAAKFSVQSPLETVTKEQVRAVARHFGLPNWNYAASPCLRSRLALGVEATEEHLHRIEVSERYVRQRLSDVLDETSNLRVRLLAGNTACIEVDESILQRANDEDWEKYFVDERKFSSFRVRAFKSGSVARKPSDSMDEPLSSFG